MVMMSASAARGQSPEMASAQSRIERARSLAVVGNFTAAATELEAIRGETTDDAVRDVAGILLMGVYIKQSNYTRADAMLDASFKARAKEQENTTRLYFTLAGQLINATRSRLDGYREFGLNPASTELSAEARSDVDQLRVLLERVIEQAKQISDEHAGSVVAASGAQGTGARNMDATALIEDAAAVRLTLSRDVRERTQWQREVAEARQRLVSGESRAATRNRAPVNRAAASPPAAATTTLASANRSGDTTAAPAAATNSNAPAQTARPDASVVAPTSTPTPSSPATPQQNAADTAKTNPPPPPNANAKPVVVGSLTDKATQRVSPNYPPTARSLRISGIVTVFVVVNEKGTVETVERLSGPNLLQSAAADAARRWRFKPTLVDGQPVRVAGYISFNFAL